MRVAQAGHRHRGRNGTWADERVSSCKLQRGWEVKCKLRKEGVTHGAELCSALLCHSGSVSIETTFFTVSIETVL